MSTPATVLIASTPAEGQALVHALDGFFGYKPPPPKCTIPFADQVAGMEREMRRLRAEGRYVRAIKDAETFQAMATTALDRRDYRSACDYQASAWNALKVACEAKRAASQVVEVAS